MKGCVRWVVIWGAAAGAALSATGARAGGEAASAMSCNDGAMIVEQVGDESFEVRVFDLGVVNYFKELEGAMVEGRTHGYESNPWVHREWPAAASLESSVTGSEVLLVGTFRGSAALEEDFRFYTTQHGPTLEKVGRGIKLVLDNHKVTGSHSYVSYEYGNWFFENCEVEPLENL